MSLIIINNNNRMSLAHQNAQYSFNPSHKIYYDSEVSSNAYGSPHSHSRINSFEGSNSKVYSKPGSLKRNEAGYQGVRLTEKITQQFSENQNQKILEQFQKDANQFRRKKKFGHALVSNTSKNALKLPVINERKTIVESRVQNYLQSPTQKPNQQVMTEQKQQTTQNEDENTVVFYRNVGVNTNKQFQLYHLKRYAKLEEKYEKLKQKYKQKKLKSLRIKTESDQEMEMENRIRSYTQDNHIKDLEHSLIEINQRVSMNSQKMINKNNLKFKSQTTEETRRSLEELMPCVTEIKQIEKYPKENIVQEGNNEIAREKSIENICEKKTKIVYSRKRGKAIELERVNKKMLEGKLKTEY